MRNRILSAALLFFVPALIGCGSGGHSTLGSGAGSFAVSAQPASKNVVQGQSTSYPMTTTASGGFANTVTLSVSGLPSGATAAFNPTSVQPTANGTGSTMTITTTTGSAPTPVGSYTLTVTGAAGGVTKQTTVTLVVDPAQTTGNLHEIIQ